MIGALGCVLLASCVAPEDVQEEPTVRVDVWITPDSASAGVPRNIEIWGDRTSWETGEVRVDFGEGVEVGVLLVDSRFHLTAQVLVADDAQVGARDVTVTWPGYVETLRDAFVVEEGSIAIAPGRASLGDTTTVEVTGWGTNFQPSYTVLSMGSAVQIQAMSVLSSSRLRATVHIPLRSSPGPVDVVAYNPGGEIYTLASGFLVDRDSRTMTIDPAEADQGEVLVVRVTAEGAELDPAATELDLGTGVVINELSVLDSERLLAEIRVGNNAAPGPRDVVVRTWPGGAGAEQTRILLDGFVVNPIDADPLRARVSLSFGQSRIFQPEECSFRRTVYASALFYEPNDFPCPSSGASSTLAAPPHFDTPGTGFASSGGSTDCPATKTFDAGPFVQFVGPNNTITLDRIVNTYTGRVSYRGLTLNPADYRTDTIYALHTPGGDLGFSELPPWDIDEVLHTMPIVYEQYGPDYCGLEHPLDEPLTVQWEPAQTYDEAEMYLYLLGPGQSEGTPLMLLYPWDDGEFTYDTDTLEFFTAGPTILLQTAYRQVRFQVPESQYVNAGIGTSNLLWRGSFYFSDPE